VVLSSDVGKVGVGLYLQKRMV